MKKNCSIQPIENHRKREKGVLVYPVYSRRSGGLSIGINLFPDIKSCSFDCPYCEVFPFSSNAVFSAEQMEEDLRSAVTDALEQSISVKDICFSGNGEPTLSPDFPEALLRAGRVRGEMVPAADLVLISNGSFLLEERLFLLLKDAAAGSPGLNIWLKLDAGTPGWYRKMSRSGIPFDRIIKKMGEFITASPVTIQTMVCAVDGEGPPPEETEAWEKLVLEFVTAAAQAGRGGGARKVQIYGKARPSPEDPKAGALPVEFLEERAGSLRRVLAAASSAGTKIIPPPVEVYP